MITYATKLMTGITLISVPTIAFGGYFLLTILSGKQEALALTDFQKAMFRAGHAHAGVIVLLSLICQILVDFSALSEPWRWTVRVAIVLAALMISGGFFAAAGGAGRTTPSNLIYLLYAGVFFLTYSVITLGVGLIRG
ncbi:hypothetical protein BH24BAC1_BH24BAC1_14790 [soil metagenome]